MGGASRAQGRCSICRPVSSWQCSHGLGAPFRCFAHQHCHREVEQYLSDRQRIAEKEYLIRDNVAPLCRRPVRHYHSSVLPYLTSKRKSSLLNQVAEKPRSNDQCPLPLIPPDKGDDMTPESSRRLKGKISSLLEDLSVRSSSFERPINEKELDSSILSRGKEILNQSFDI